MERRASSPVERSARDSDHEQHAAVSIARTCGGPDRPLGTGGPGRVRRLECWPVRGGALARNHFCRRSFLALTTKKPGWQAVQGRFAEFQPGLMAFPSPIRSLMLSRLTSTTLMLDIETMDAEQ